MYPADSQHPSLHVAILRIGQSAHNVLVHLLGTIFMRLLAPDQVGVPFSNRMLGRSEIGGGVAWNGERGLDDREPLVREASVQARPAVGYLCPLLKV